MCVRACVPVCTCVNHPRILHYRNQQHGLRKRGAFSAFHPISCLPCCLQLLSTFMVHRKLWTLWQPCHNSSHVLRYFRGQLRTVPLLVCMCAYFWVHAMPNTRWTITAHTSSEFGKKRPGRILRYSAVTTAAGEAATIQHHLTPKRVIYIRTPELSGANNITKRNLVPYTVIAQSRSLRFAESASSKSVRLRKKIKTTIRSSPHLNDLARAVQTSFR